MNKLLTGNEAIARGAWEAGVKFASAYPGTPSTEILENTALYKEDILAEVDAKLSKISFSKPADLEIKDGDTKPKTKNRAAEILASK